jgi:hypothetical protein
MADTPYQHTIRDVTRDLSALVTLTKVLSVDEDNYLVDTAVGQRFKHQLDANDTPREIAIFQDPMPKGDILFFNPFAEGFGRKSPAVQLYYRLIRVALNINIRTVALYIAHTIVNVKKAEAAKETYSLPGSLVRMSSVPFSGKTTLYDVADEKLIGEFDKLFDRIDNDLVAVPYLKQQRMAKITVPALTDDQWDAKYGVDIRKKSLAAFKSVIMGILGISKPEELDNFTVKHDPDVKTAVRLHTTLSVYLKIYSKFNDILADAYGIEDPEKDKVTVDLGELGDVIERLPLSYAIAKHMVQPVMPSVGATDTSTVDTTRISLGGNPANRSRFAGPPTIDAFGREQRGGQTFSIGTPVDAGSTRFKPHVIQDQKIDPFAPATRSSGGGAFGQSGGFNSGGGAFNSGGFVGGGLNPPASGFGGQGGYFGGGNERISLSATPSSNFGMPGGRSYF